MTSATSFRNLIVGLFAWAMTIFFGAVLLDVAYSRAAPEVATAADGKDLLLWIGSLAVLAGIGAFAASLGSVRTSVLIIASLAVVSLEFLGPALFSQFVEAAEDLGVGHWVRLSIMALASILAFAGSCEFHRFGTRRPTGT
jgi:hypothetical protein